MRRSRLSLCLFLTVLAAGMATPASSAAAKPAAPHEVLVASGENYPDAVVAAVFDEPTILTERNRLTPEALDGLLKLRKRGVSFVAIIGGTDAISNRVARAIGRHGFQVQRIGGVDRYETAAFVAARFNSLSGIGSAGGLPTALIINGQSYSDGLAAGPLSAVHHLPILWVESDNVPTAVSAAITKLNIKQVFVVGGTRSVRSLVEAMLVALTGQPAKRLAGRDRFETAHAINRYQRDLG